jgi:hypothetical protein
MAATRQGGAGINLPVNFPVPLASSSTSFITAGAGPVALAGGESILVPAGNWYIQCGPYSFIQVKDPISGLWRMLGQTPNESRFLHSDGSNVRVANLTGTPVGSLITNVGSGYTSAPTVTASAGSSAWTAIVGGAINSTIAITTAGAGYTHPPILLFDPPPAGGLQATAYATITAGAISAVTVTNQGAGYTTVPNCYVIPFPGDTPTTTAVLTVNATLAGSGTVTAIVCTDPGTAVTSVPTLTISGGGGASAAATAVMCFAATGITVTDGGTGYGNAQPFLVQFVGGITTGTPGAVVNPQVGTSILTPRAGVATGTSTAGGLITATGLVIADAGLFQAVPKAIVTAGGSGLATDTGEATVTVGGAVDTVYFQPY